MMITRRLHGKIVDSVMTNGYDLKIVASDNTELTVSWVDSEGRKLKGHPVVTQYGHRLTASRMGEMLYLPQIRMRGEA